MNATSHCPKKFRFTLVSKLHNYSLSALESLYRSNEIFVKNSSKAELEKRISLQYQAFSELNVLTFFYSIVIRTKVYTKKRIYIYF